MVELVALNLRDIKGLRQSEMPTKGAQVGKTARRQANNKRRALPAQSAIVSGQKNRRHIHMYVPWNRTKNEIRNRVSTSKRRKQNPRESE